ncbi:hypothetical protein AB6883_12815 [Carnobacterium maltaromaticum]|uniref:hypothetical protein n=1 Tax=Carnobacterium maltaromaticum TaxID=2751 RepID=UPI002891A04B|nr:hypothetical protein [Carnobacterium maltaromaticum]MDT1943360.1 hypothetical protein [Carnobacterium maltaromaticum]MDT1998740.1 hypothetical protein [Carnobacterium maltaromaticum]
MTKIDESKQYKFSEIIAMLENSELPEGTELTNAYYSANHVYVVSKLDGFDSDCMFDKRSSSVANMDIRLISYLWSIKLPKEDKFYLKAPGAFKSKYLNLHIPNDHYFLSDKSGSEIYQTQFTKKEIDAMPFDTTFFGEPIKAEQADE